MQLPSSFQQVIHTSRYAKYKDEVKRRESWIETVDRYINFMYHGVKKNPNVTPEKLHELYLILGATCDE